MKNILISFLNSHVKCLHKNALLNQNEGYCPDCGQYLIKNYYIVRCACCDIKREAKICWGEIIPTQKYCENCGSSDFYIEKIDNVTFVDSKYAIYLKEIQKEYEKMYPETQVWVDTGKFTARIAKKY